MSVTDPDAFSLDRSPYERPTFPWRCGREAMWDRPCAQGPTFGGGCGGTSECKPFKQGDRWECRRPAAAGGRCQDGPLPDGRCCRTHPPCVPLPTLRKRRGRYSTLTLGVVLAGIAAFSYFSPGGSGRRLSSFMPGPLSGPHASFTRADGCAACHEAHGAGIDAWLAAAFQPADISGGCIGCHRFGGDPRTPHNFDPAVAPGQTTRCDMCHTEHRGAEARLTEIGDAQCASCHKQAFDSFAGGHPDFGPSFPYSRRNPIRFDHTAHLERHFNDPRMAGRGARRCTDCHDVATAGQRVEPRGYAVTCAPCHGEQVPRNRLLLFRLPEIPESAFDAAQVEETLGLPPNDIAENGAISVEVPSAFSAWLLEVDGEDPEDYGAPVQGLLLEMATAGVTPLAERLEQRVGAEVSAAMLRGLNHEAVRQPAWAWAANLEYEGPTDSPLGGWQTDYQEIVYIPSGHGDAVLRAWLDFALQAVAQARDEEDRRRAQALKEVLLSPLEGPGSCAKCHALSDRAHPEGGGPHPGLTMEWGYRGSDHSPYHVFAHRPHINLLGPDQSCTLCHRRAPEADYAAAFEGSDPTRFTSNFQPIRRETCRNCHSDYKVRQDCRLCHRYHLEPSFAGEMMRHADEEAAGE